MKRVKLLMGFAAIAALFLSGCTSALKLTEGQEATMSKQAVDTLKTLKVFHVPFINISDKMIIKARGQFAEIEKQQLNEMKQKFNPTIADTTINGVHVYIITPQNIKPENRDKIILYIHGGGFVMGSATDRTGMLMTNELGFKTYAVDYQLAPEAKFPVAMNECLEVYKYLVTKYNPDNIVGISTSAGSTHMLGMLLNAKKQNLPMINSISLLSPAADISSNGDAIVANNGRDVLAYKNQADKFYIKPFIGKEDPTNPMITPVYADYSGDFPATSIVTGTRDMFLSSSSRLYWKIKKANVSSELLVGEGMWHAYTNYTDIPEAVEARKASQQFLLNELRKKEQKPASVTQNNTEANKAIVLRFVNEVINKGHTELVDELWSKDLTWYGGSLGEVKGIENYKKMLQGASKGSFSNMHLKVKDIVTSGDKVVLYFSNSGKNVGDFMGNKATGKSANWDGMGIYRIENGKIAEAWFSEDILGMYQQLGFIK